MAFKLADRVKQTATTTGTGAFALSATPTGYRAFSSVLSTSDTTYYCIAHQTANEWEVGFGTYSSANTLTRTAVISSTNSNNAVSFSAGTKDVFITQPAIGENNNVTLGTNITQSQTSTSEAVAIGVSVVNNSSESVAIGYLATTGTSGSAAIGKSASATGIDGVAVGKSANASGTRNTALGTSAITNSNYVVAVGADSSISGLYATGIGYGANVSADGVAAVGSQVNASGPYSVAIGYQATTMGGPGLDASGVAIGPTALAYGQWAIAIGSGTKASVAADIAIGASTKTSTGGSEIRIGATQDAGGPGLPSTGSGNTLIGHGINTYADNPSSSIAIIASDGTGPVTVVESNATYMNKFRIDPATGLVGPAYTLTYDSSTHEVYAVTAGPTPPTGFDWFLAETSATPLTTSIAAPTNYTAAASGPDSWVVAASVNVPFGIGPPWNNGSTNGWGSGMYYLGTPNWSSVTSPVVYCPFPGSGMVASYLIYPAGHSLTSLVQIQGNSSNFASGYGTNVYANGPSVGSTQKMYGVIFIQSGGTDYTSSIGYNPTLTSLSTQISYDGAFAGTTLVAFQITDTAEVTSVLGAPWPVIEWPTQPPTNWWAVIWYEWS